MNENFSFLHLIVQASWVVQLVMLILVAASVASWAVIVQKVKALRLARQDNEAFESDFWSGSAIAEIYQNIGRKADRTAMERIFVNGMREFIKLHERQLDPDTQVDGARRAMRVSCQRELDHIDSHTSLLASVGSVAPYIGLFGTVWGIMHAFVGLAALEQVSLSTVAPGIAEALVATAMGLFAAIPAVLGYNRFTRDIDRIAMQWDNFTDEFSNLLQRQIPHPGSGLPTAVAPEFAAQPVMTNPMTVNPYEADQYRSAPGTAAEPQASYGHAQTPFPAPAPASAPTAPAAPRSPFAPPQAQHPQQHPQQHAAPAPLQRPGAALPSRLPPAPNSEEHPRAGELFDPKRMAGRPGQREI